MAKKRKPIEEDINLIASRIVSETTQSKTPQQNHSKQLSVLKPEKNPAAVTLGRLGGLKGGKARAEKLSAKRRKEIAKKAANTRWLKVY